MIAEPKEILANLNLESNFHVAEFGSGSGNYSLELAQILENGKLYAIEIQKEMVDSLNRQFESKNFKNSVAVWGDLERMGGSRLRDNSVDFVLIANVLFQARDKNILMNEAKRILKKNSKLAIIDWSESFNNLGPTQEMVFNKEDAIKLANENSFSLVSDFPAGNYHYGVIFFK